MRAARRAPCVRHRRRDAGARDLPHVEALRQALGSRHAGTWSRIGAHTPRIDVVDATLAARAAGTDLLVTLGGGSVTDAAKMIGMCLANDITAPAQLDPLRGITGADGITRRPPTRSGSVRTISIPTTLSAGEFSSFAGCTDTAPADGGPSRKESYASDTMIPISVILDPTLTVATPTWLWLSTGIRAVDHAVEDLCSSNSQPMSDGASLHALRLLNQGLRAAMPTRPIWRRGWTASWVRMSMVGSQANRRQQGCLARHRPRAGRHRGSPARLHPA
jgi:maleylacetate reductase